MAGFPSIRLVSSLRWPTLASNAAPTVACHCYQDRTFDPERPAAADPYILATTRSSLLSAAFGVDKRALAELAVDDVLESRLHAAPPP